MGVHEGNDRWDLIGTPEPDGHGYFQDRASARKLGIVRIALADQSGPDPGQTDGGPVYLDASRAIIEMPSGLHLIPVRDRDGNETRTCAGKGEARWVADKFHLATEYGGLR